jgi:hypothetical protein
MKMVTVNIESRLPPGQRFEQLSRGLTALLPYLSVRNACINLAFAFNRLFSFLLLKVFIIFTSFAYFITIFLFWFSCGPFCCHVWKFIFSF